MDNISNEESLDSYLTTLSYLDEKHVESSDDQLKYIIDELEGDAYTFLHNFTVEKLVNEKLIPEAVIQKSEILRTLVIDLIDRKSKLQEIRFDDEWKSARQFAKELQELIRLYQEQKSTKM